VALPIALPLSLAGVFVASGIAKLRRPDDLAGWQELGVPAVFRRRWLIALHPWGELALALALAVLGGILGLLASVVAVALMGAYLWIVIRAKRTDADSSCACFGTRKPITGVTIARNAWLTLLALAAASVIWITPLFGGAVAVAVVSADAWPWLLALAVAAVTVAFILWSEESGEASTATEQSETLSASNAGSDDEEDYIRTRTPAVPVTLANGETVNLRTLSMQGPILLLAVSETCGSCTPVIEAAPAWRSLLPELDVRCLLRHEPDAGLTEHAEPQSLHDPEGYVRDSISDWGTPTAVLLGRDGLLAGGPVTGTDAIAEFVADVYENLHGERPPAEALQDTA
jgi:hypothetical protein